jgi:hypothetical protein
MMLGGAAAILSPNTALADEGAIVPFFLDEWNTAYIYVKVNGAGPYRFRLTTGALINTLATDLIGINSLKPYYASKNKKKRADQTVTLGKIEFTHDYLADSIEFGGIDGIEPNRALTFNDVIFTSTRPQPSSEKPDVVVGCLGAGIFNKMPCEIDNVRNVLRFYRDENPDMTGYALSGRIYRANIPYDDTQVDIPIRLGDESLTCAVDTGGMSELYLSSRYAHKHKLYELYPEYKLRPISKTRPGGMVRVTRMRDLTIAGTHFDEINTTFPEPSYDDELNELDINAVLSGRLLRQFDTAFVEGQVWLRPNVNFKPVSGPQD